MPKLPSAIVVGSIVALFFVAGFAVYGQSLQNQFVSWDDMLLIAENPNVKKISVTTVKNIFTSYDPELYIPLTFLSYQIDNLIGGNDPFMIHLTNLVFHILNSLLVAWLLYALLKRGWLAVALGIIFLVHPLNTEAAVWASSRKDLLSTFFFLSSLLTWLHFRDSKKSLLYAASLLLFLCGALSKVMVVTLPVVLVMIDILNDKKFDRRVLAAKVPFFLIAIIFGIIGLFGKTTVLVASTGMQKVLMACKATIFYILKFFIPYDLSVMYPYTKVITFSSPDFYIPALLVVILLAIAWRVWSQSRLITFGIIFFLLTLAPTFINFSKGGDIYFASDRYTYIPLIGLLIIVGVIVRAWMERPGGVRLLRSRRYALLCSTGVIVVLFGSLASVQAATWKNGKALYEHTISLYPNARAAHNNLGMEYFLLRDYEEAIRHFDDALGIRLDSKSQANRAAALVALGRLDEALEEFQKALALEPDLPDAMYGIGNIYQKKGDLLKAAEQYRLTLAVAPDYANALNNLGAVYIQLHDWDHAIETLKAAIDAKPDFIESYYNLAGVYEEKGMRREAEDMYRKALALHAEDPDALARLATLVYDRGEIDEAAQLLMASLKMDSSNPTAVSMVLRMKKDGVAE